MRQDNFNEKGELLCRKHTTNISIDRIDSNKGYTKDNIQLVCSHVNMMKSDLSLEELYSFL